MPERPDALMMPAALKRGKRMPERVGSICDVAEPLLQCDRAGGERAWIRIQLNNRLFITRSPDDTILYPREHALAGRPRYRWEKGEGDVELGYLLP
jgi:hypothetical protein